MKFLRAGAHLEHKFDTCILSIASYASKMTTTLYPFKTYIPQSDLPCLYKSQNKLKAYYYCHWCCPILTSQPRRSLRFCSTFEVINCFPTLPQLLYCHFREMCSSEQRSFVLRIQNFIAETRHDTCTETN